MFCWQYGNMRKPNASQQAVVNSIKKLAVQKPSPKFDLAPQEPPKPYFAATRAGKRRLTLVVAPEEHRRVKRLSADTARTMEDLLREALMDLLRKHNA
jgi:hypothetical protein